MGENNGAAPVRIEVLLEPKTLPELYGALGSTQGVTGTAFLKSMGVVDGAARRMKSGAIVDIGVMVQIMERFSITPTQFVALAKATVSGVSSATPRRVGRPRKAAAENSQA